MIKRAIISVSDKSGIVEFSKKLSDYNIEIISTGGTYKVLKQNNIICSSIESVTGFPEILEGRVKTLHPMIYGAILFSRNNENHQNDIKMHKIKSIDMIVVNLYPFEEYSKNISKVSSEIIEQIDVGGVSLLRAGAKNFKDIIVISDKNDYQNILSIIHKNKIISLKKRLEFAKKAFEYTSRYDKIIYEYFNSML